MFPLHKRTQRSGNGDLAEREKEAGRSNGIPAQVINGVGLHFMDRTLPVTPTIDHLQCHPGNQQLGHTLYKSAGHVSQGQVSGPQAVTPQKRIEHREFISCL